MFSKGMADRWDLLTVGERRQAIASPVWAIHCGVGISRDTVIWSAGGDYPEFGDMDLIAMDKA